MADLSPESLKKENTYGRAVKDRLVELLKFSPGSKTAEAQEKIEPKLGTGMAENARKALKSIPYQKHLAEAKATGETPMTPEEFAEIMGEPR